MFHDALCVWWSYESYDYIFMSIVFHHQLILGRLWVIARVIWTQKELVANNWKTQKAWTRLGLGTGTMVFEGTRSKQHKRRKHGHNWASKREKLSMRERAPNNQNAETMDIFTRALWFQVDPSGPGGNGHQTIKTQKPWTLLRGHYGSKSTLVDPYINLYIYTYIYICMSCLGLM